VTASLYHIVAADDWDEASGHGWYAPEGFAAEGFIHLSDLGQLLRPANLLYRGRTDLAVLVIDPDRLTADVVYEPGSHGEDEHFPHLYGRLNVEAVVDVVAFPCGESGGFELPVRLRTG
jgi:uncharacterized protein (DUF952 family)